MHVQCTVVILILVIVHDVDAIVGGEVAEYGEFPHQVALLRYGGYACGGSIVTSRCVVTAASCCEGIGAANLLVRAGDQERSVVEQFQVDRNVSKVVSHEDHDGWAADSDICLLEVSSPFELNDYVSTIELPPSMYEDPAGLVCTVLGWGATEEGGQKPNDLSKVDVPIVSDKRCNESYGVLMEEDMICAGIEFGGKGFCWGDAGGPLICDGHLSGVVSWGMGCAQPATPQIYTQVSHFRDWLDTKMHYHHRCFD